VGDMLTAGYLEDFTWHATYSGAPQGGVCQVKWDTSVQFI
jgi:hypothetical protein